MPTLSASVNHVPTWDGSVHVSSCAVGVDRLLYCTLSQDGIVRTVDARAGDFQVQDIRTPDLAPDFPNRLGWRGDELWLGDLAGSTIASLNAAGDVVRVEDMWLPGPFGPIRAGRILALLSGDRIIVRASVTAQALAMSSAAGDAPEAFPLPSSAVTEAPVWVADFEGTVLDTLMMLSQGRRLGVVYPPRSRAPRGTSAVFMFTQPFADPPLLGVSPTGEDIVVLDRAVASIRAMDNEPVYTVHWFTPDGDTIRSLEYPYEPVVIEEAWVREWSAAQAPRLSTDLEEGAELALQALYRPAVLPPVSSFLVGTDGTIWVRREEVPDAETVMWELIAPDGSRLGQVELDAELGISAVHGREAWAFERHPDESLQLWYLSVEAPTPGPPHLGRSEQSNPWL
ncbi:MAG: hypothetical protein WD960_01190 [Gemmatimonadota bacterium]